MNVAFFIKLIKKFFRVGLVMEGSNLFLIVLIVFAVMTVIKGFQQVPLGYVYLVERLGKCSKILHPGLNLISPYIDTIAHRVNMICLLYTSPSPRDGATSRMPSSA